MNPRPPKYDANDPRRAKDARDAFRMELRNAILRAIENGWREAEAALALADAADDYVLYLSERPRRSPTAANSN